MLTAEEFPDKADLLAKNAMVDRILGENKFILQYPKFVLSQSRCHRLPLFVLFVRKVLLFRFAHLRTFV